MSEVEVLKVRMDNAETDIRRHEILIERIADTQGEMKTGLAEVATELKVTNSLIEKSTTLMNKIILGLFAMLASVLGVGSQVM
tara:strand:- start:431 stop:679 length:249 start_codon:yes stop_codon:yes gene_type:complete